MARHADSVDIGWPDRPARLRAQLARMSESQLRRLLVWLDQRGAAAGKTFAVHQADPRDPASRDLIEIQVSGFSAEDSRPKLRLPELSGRMARHEQAARA